MSQEHWSWFGQPGHFCAAHNCLYHLHTHVGGDDHKPHRYCVSTVGEYHLRGYQEGTDPQKCTPMGASTERYETMVFRLDRRGENIRNHSELETIRTDGRDDAAKAHLKLCLKYDQPLDAASTTSSQEPHSGAEPSTERA